MTAPLQAALEAAVAAGDVLRMKISQPRAVQSKGWRDIVTDADVAAQQSIVEVLSAYTPDFALLSEEGRPGVALTAPGPVWIIDPLDGTTNYARQLPSFSVAIALMQHGAIELGVIHDPMRRETFFAGRGQGAFVQNEEGAPQPMHVSDLAGLEDALVGVDWARDPELRARTLEGAARVSSACRTLRALGSAALGLAYVASARLDGYFHLSLQPWDVAAGALLVSEAGGTITALDGAVWQPGAGQAVASNGHLQPALLNVLALA
jgi:myo-inositol-1(or 4)-monophosphatase